MKRNLLLGFFVLGIVFLLPGCVTVRTYSAESIETWVVDDESKQPIEGAVIVAHWELIGGLHPDRVGDLVVLETVTDKKGRFYFPAWGPKTYWGTGELTYRDPELIIFKSGYEYRRLGNPATTEAIEGRLPSVRSSQWNGKVVQMKKFTGTPTEWFQNLQRAIPSYDRRDDAKQSLILKAILAEEPSIPDSINYKRSFFNNVVRRLLEEGK